VRVTGEGTVSMPPKTMDYKVNIAAVATKEGQGGAQQGGVGIPVNCKGTWAQPNCAPDLAGMFMGDPTKLLKGIMGGAGGGLPIPGVGGAAGGGLPIPGGLGGSIPGLGGGAAGGAAAPAAGGAPAAAPAAPAAGGGLPGGLQNLIKKP